MQIAVFPHNRLTANRLSKTFTVSLIRPVCGLGNLNHAGDDHDRTASRPRLAAGAIETRRPYGLHAPREPSLRLRAEDGSRSGDGYALPSSRLDPTAKNEFHPTKASLKLRVRPPNMLMNVTTSGQLLSVLLLAACLLGTAVPAEAAPKKVLVVTVTKGFRHSSIATAEKILGELAAKSGAFTVDYARVEPSDPQFRGADGKADTNKINAAIEKVLAEKMSAAALAKLDGVIFANTTGDLPLPDKQAFLDWIKSGKAFMGMHSATDTFRGHKPLDPYVEMIGAEFKRHGAVQPEVDCLNQDPKHPACQPLPETWHLKDEIYEFNGFERSKVHGLLTLDKSPQDKTPGDYPISWCKNYGKGRVFYTSLGHREDVWDPNTPENFKRENSKEISETYQKHILGGIKWALGLAPGDAKPQSVKP